MEWDSLIMSYDFLKWKGHIHIYIYGGGIIMVKDIMGN